MGLLALAIAPGIAISLFIYFKGIDSITGNNHDII